MVGFLLSPTCCPFPRPSSHLLPRRVVSQLVARSLDNIAFPLSKWSILDLRFFHLVFATLLKCFSNGVQPIADCFEILRFHIIFSIESFSEGFGTSNDIASNFDLIVHTVYVCMCVCMYVCMFVCMYVCMYV